MQDKSISLTEAEWSVMECLWDHSPKTGREVVQWLQERTNWSRSTCLTLLRRLESKAAVGSDSNSEPKLFYPLIGRSDAAICQTKSLIDRAYHGSLSLLVSAFTKEASLSQAEIDELYSILKEMEEKKDA